MKSRLVKRDKTTDKESDPLSRLQGKASFLVKVLAIFE